MSKSIIKLTCPKCRFIWESIMPKKVSRTNPQNRYFHGVVLPILSGHTGYSTEEMKIILKSMFLRDISQIKLKDGSIKEVSIVKETSQLKTDEFEKFMDDIRIWGSSELGCYIPEPNEENYVNSTKNTQNL